MPSRDELHQEALSLLSKQYRLLKQAKRAAMPERAGLLREAQLAGRQAEAAVIRFQNSAAHK